MKFPNFLRRMPTADEVKAVIVVTVILAAILSLVLDAPAMK